MSTPIRFVLKEPPDLQPDKKYKIVVHEAYFTMVPMLGYEDIGTAEFRILISIEEDTA